MDSHFVCERCSQVAWKELAVPFPKPKYLPKVTEDLDQLQASPCRICRLFATMITTHRLLNTPLRLQSRYDRLDLGPNTDWRRRGQRLYGETLFGLGEASTPGIHLLVTSLKPAELRAQMKHLFPSHIDFDAIRRLGIISNADEPYLTLDRLYMRLIDTEYVREVLRNLGPQGNTLYSLLDSIDNDLEIIRDKTFRANWFNNYPLRSETSQFLPRSLKVIDCKKLKIVPAPSGCQYVALSYVWGLSIENDRTFKPSLCFAPQTIKDAIAVTLALNLRYLWVDRYCIDQRDDIEKQKQIEQMGNIYAAANLTLIAAAGSNPSYGLPGVQARAQAANFPYEVMDSMTLCVYPPSGLSDIAASSWASRAWTFQEGYLSNVRVFFTDRQMILNTGTQIQYEAADRPFGPSELGPLEEFLHVQHSASEPYYETMKRAMVQLRAYSQRTLTHDEDALDAIVGALNVIARSSPGEERMHHIWGTPVMGVEDGTFSIALDWYHGRPCRRRAGFPSWSLLGWDGPIEWSDESTPWELADDQVSLWGAGDSSRLSFMQQSFPSARDKAYGKSNIKGECYQFLQIRACAVNVTLTHLMPSATSGVRPNTSQSKSCIAIELNASMDILYTVLWDIPPGELAKHCDLIAVPLGIRNLARRLEFDRWALVLQPHGSHYERVGMFNFGSSLCSWMTDGIYLRDKSGTVYENLSEKALTIAGSERDLEWWASANFQERRFAFG